MQILMKMAWRNIWRNPRRTWVLVTTIALGVFGYLCSIGVQRGFLNQMVDSAISLHSGHIRISKAGESQNPGTTMFIEPDTRLGSILDSLEGVVSAPSVSLSGMVNSPEASSGVSILGIDPDLERQITIVANLVKDGRYLIREGDNAAVLISRALAKRLQVGVGDKVVVLTTALDNTISSAAFRIIGLFESPNRIFDRSTVFVTLAAARELAGYGQQLTAWSLRLPDDGALEQTLARLHERLPASAFDVRSWKDRFPLVVLSIESFSYFAWVFIAIVFTAVAFSILNSYLMVVFERMHEIGVMKAMGVVPGKVRILLLFESVLLALIGGIVGGAAGWLVIAWLGYTGLDLSVFAEGLGTYGVGHIIFPAIVGPDVAIVTGGVFVLVVAAAAYPAWRASRFKTVEALTHV